MLNCLNIIDKMAQIFNKLTKIYIYLKSQKNEKIMLLSETSIKLIKIWRTDSIPQILNDKKCNFNHKIFGQV